LFLNTFRELFCAVSSEGQELKDQRTDEHYGIERTAAFDLGWDGNSVKRGQLRFNGLEPFQISHRVEFRPKFEALPARFHNL
jgi:hypothetical protein